MASRSSSARLSAISGQIENSRVKMTGSTQAPDQLPWDPNCARFPLRKELPRLPNSPEGAAWVWGKDDQVCVCTSSLLAILMRV